MGRNLGNDLPKQDPKRDDLLWCILGHLNAYHSIRRRNRAKERNVCHNRRFCHNSVFFGADRTSESYKGFNKGRKWDIKNRDVEMIKKEVKDIEAISPIFWGNKSEKNISYGHVSGSFHTQGIQPDFFKIMRQVIIYGRQLNEIDEIKKRKVCMIGEQVNDVLFQGKNPCGKYIKVNGIYYQVIGVQNKSHHKSTSVNALTNQCICPSRPYNRLQRLEILSTF